MARHLVETEKFLKEIISELTSHARLAHDTPEKWCEIKSYPDYLISNWGRVVSFKNNTTRILKPHTEHYKRIVLSKNSILKTFYIHRLVGIYFVNGKTKLKNTINHKDTNKLNNYYKNLEWDTQKHNILHALKNDKRNGLEKLNEDDVSFIRDIFPVLSCVELGQLFNVHRSTIHKIITRITWTYL